VVKRTLIDERPDSLQDCVAWARRLWQDNYSNQIRQLLFNFPSDQVCGLTHSTVHASVCSVRSIIKQNPMLNLQAVFKMKKAAISQRTQFLLHTCEGFPMEHSGVDHFLYGAV